MAATLKYINVYYPYCNSSNVTKIGTVNRAVSVGMFGLASKKIGKHINVMTVVALGSFKVQSLMCDNE